MGDWQALLAKAQEKEYIVNQVLTITYPLARDAKLLLTAVENIFLSMHYALQAFLTHEHDHARLRAIPDTYEARVQKAKSLMPEHRDALQSMTELRGIIMKHQQSPIEFNRQDRYVICSDKYQLTVITLDMIKKAHEKSKVFIHEVATILEKKPYLVVI